MNQLVHICLRKKLPGIALDFNFAFACALGLGLNLSLGTFNSALALSQTDSAALMLAQSVTANDTNSNANNDQPRIISRPQTIATDNDLLSAESSQIVSDTTSPEQPATQSTQTQVSTGSAQESGSTNTLPQWLPGGLKNTLESYLDAAQLEFVGRYFVWLLAGVAAICLLPFFLMATAADRKRAVYSEAPTSQNLHTPEKNDPLDFGELDLPDTVQADTEAKPNQQVTGSTGQTPDATTDSTLSAGTSELDLLDETQVTTDLPDSITSPGADSLNDVADLHEATIALDEASLSEATAPASQPITGESDDRSTADSAITSSTAAANSLHSESDSPAAIQAQASTAVQQPQPLTRFGLWLYDLPQDEGARAAMEAFLYWVRYGAGHIKPGLAEALATTDELDDHARIKRAVLSFRPEVLHDILLSLKMHLDPKQYMPFLDMMLAILVNGSGVKPVENLLLRYYADFIGIGSEQLDFRYRKAHGKPLPSIPRPDRMKWWNQQPTADKQLSPAHELLGIDESADAQTLDRIRRLADFRHSPERFSLLGEHERALIARSREKYHAALDSAMQVTS